MLAEILRLPVEERARLALELIRSLDTGAEASATEAWDLEIACLSRIRCQAASGSWTRSRQWETQRTLFNSARAIVWPPANVNGVWPSNDAWLRAAL